jgi:hypothetical protein
MDENLAFTRKMIANNPYAIVKAATTYKRLMVETLEVDEDGDIWCWIDEDGQENQLSKFNDASVCLKYTDKRRGRFMTASGTFITTNFIPPHVAGCFSKNNSGYLCKVDVQEYEYFEKKKITAHTNILDSIKKYSLSIVQRLQSARLTTAAEQQIYYSDPAA